MTTETYTISASGKASITKDPDAVLDYSLDLTDWLAGISDTLTSHSVTGDGVVIDSSAIDGSLVVAWISGGTAGETASATFRFTTTVGRTDDRTIFLKIKDR
jgi:hypothetical protein